MRLFELLCQPLLCEKGPVRGHSSKDAAISTPPHPFPSAPAAGGCALLVRPRRTWWRRSASERRGPAREKGAVRHTPPASCCVALGCFSVTDAPKSVGRRSAAPPPSCDPAPLGSRPSRRGGRDTVSAQTHDHTLSLELPPTPTPSKGLCSHAPVPSPDSTPSLALAQALQRAPAPRARSLPSRHQPL